MVHKEESHRKYDKKIIEAQGDRLEKIDFVRALHVSHDMSSRPNNRDASFSMPPKNKVYSGDHEPVGGFYTLLSSASRTAINTTRVALATQTTDTSHRCLGCHM